MKSGYVKLSIPEYDALMIGNYTKSQQLARQEEKISELEEQIAELQEELNEKSKIEKEMREYINALKEAEK